MFKNLLLLIAIFLISFILPIYGQRTDANVFGDVKSSKNNEHIPFASVYIEGTTFGTTTDETGHYMLIDLPEGIHVIVARFIGYSIARDTITIVKGKTLEVNFVIDEQTMTLNEVVVTGTRTSKRQTESAVIVNVLEHKTLNLTQTVNISEGLHFQPGLRVETDCQTCNYTQLRINGLGGGYSQILINGRPIFSPLIGLYGLEQIPANMIERIEVVRGGGSALYGSSAIGGTVNIITRIPEQEIYDISLTTQRINGRATDNVITGNLSLLNTKRNVGGSIFINHRNRQAYDFNGDNFSELPELTNNSFGVNFFIHPTYNQELEISLTSLYEYRYGGEMINDPAHVALQSEERIHNILMGGLDYQVDFNANHSSLIAYLAGQHTDRNHYTGIMPDPPEEIEIHFADPPYGYTKNTTLQAGMQVNHLFQNSPGGNNMITLGSEFVYDDVFDTIPSYNYETDQITKNMGGFIQSDWDITDNFNVLTGLRIDKHNMVDKVIYSPRVSLLYKLKNYTQFRLVWGTGFRAPQAFDADMHIAFAGGGVSRISLAPDLKEERSNSFSGSVNFDKATEKFIAGFTIEAFYTKLNNAFYLHPIGEDEFGEQFEKRNGPGATVQGGTLELRANYSRKLQLEAGYTLQSSLFDKPVDNIEGLESKREFLRSPKQYGYGNLLITPNEHVNASINTIYTGPMELAHFAGAPEQATDEYLTSRSFIELNFRIGYTIIFKSVDSGVEIYGGIKNLTNAYQDDFDSGKYRDSSYIYGPSNPRIIYLGFNLKSL